MFSNIYDPSNIHIYHPMHTHFVEYPSDDPYIAILIDGVAIKFAFFAANLHPL